MYKLNILQYNNMQNLHIKDDMSLNILSNNEEYNKTEKEFKEKYSFGNINSFSFSKSGFLSLLLELNKKGKIAISVGETQSLIDAAILFEELGFEIIWIDLLKDGNVNIQKLEDLEMDFIFISSYVMDTFVKTSIENIKKSTNAKIISNASAHFDKNSDVIYFDPYKLTGYSFHGLILFNGDLFEEQVISNKDGIALFNIFEALKIQKFEISIKDKFIEKLKDELKDDIYFFVDNTQTLPYTLHFALKNIKARELIRTLALDEIYITNGEGCSLGLSKPSRIIQAMDYDETTSRNSISLTFTQKLEEIEIEKIVNKIAKKYKQIKVLNQGN
ncbi:cysteine desulfurase [Arcobacter sp. s6]|jgi:cysteine desulfurase|uniref:cysteine desulfurase n=1 Tax=Arcobacter sp. s6 TaxID=3230363 RepID=UPI0034A014ED